MRHCILCVLIITSLLLCGIPAFANSEIWDITGVADYANLEGSLRITSPTENLLIQGTTDDAFGPVPSGPYFPDHRYRVTDGFSFRSFGSYACLNGSCVYGAFGDITWQYSFSVSDVGNPLDVSPAIVSGSFTVGTLRPESFVIATDLFSGTIRGIGDDFPTFGGGVFGGPFGMQSDFVNYTGTAHVEMDTPEPPTIFLLLGGLPLMWCFLKHERVLSARRL